MKNHNLRKLVTVARRLARGVVRCDIWIINGTEASSGSNLNIIYIGNEVHKNYIAELVFDIDYNEIYMGKKWFWEIYNIVQKNTYDCSLIFVQGHLIHRIIYKDKKDFFIPIWVQGDVCLPLDIFSKSVKSDMRRIKNNKLEFAVVTEEHHFHNFYYTMYLPYITQRHGNKTILMNYDRMMKNLTEGNLELLLVKKENRAIAGALILFEEDQPRLWEVGIKDGNPIHLRDGAIAATYFFASLYLQDIGYKRLILGSSRPFLRSGVLQYKKKWGLKLIRPTKFEKIKEIIFQSGFIVKPLSLSESLKGFFVRNPFIYADKGQFYAAIFVENDDECCEKNMKKFYKDFWLNGICQLIIYRLQEDKNEKRMSIPTTLSDKIRFSSASRLF